jgi:hypothetical protein
MAEDFHGGFGYCEEALEPFAVTLVGSIVLIIA